VEWALYQTQNLSILPGSPWRGEALTLFRRVVEQLEQEADLDVLA
jgi:hypothetical protein